MKRTPSFEEERIKIVGEEPLPNFELIDKLGKVALATFLAATIGLTARNVYIEHKEKNQNIPSYNYETNNEEHSSIQGYVIQDGNIYTLKGEELFAKCTLKREYEATRTIKIDKYGEERIYYSAPEGGTLVGDKVVIKKVEYIKVEDIDNIDLDGYKIISIDEIIQAKPYRELASIQESKETSTTISLKLTK